jgi:hypothetical protein
VIGTKLTELSEQKVIYLFYTTKLYPRAYLSVTLKTVQYLKQRNSFKNTEFFLYGFLLLKKSPRMADSGLAPAVFAYSKITGNPFYQFDATLRGPYSIQQNLQYSIQ